MTFAAAKSQRASLGIKVAKPEGIGVCCEIDRCVDFDVLATQRLDRLALVFLGVGRPVKRLPKARRD
jgi:hypothetical protein